MKMNKLKVMSVIGALGLTAGVLTACGGQQDDNDDYVKVVDSQGQTLYIPEDEFEDNDNTGMFILFSSWNGHNHSRLKPSKSYSGFKSTSKPSSVGKSGIGTKASSGRSGSGFGG